jgi:hypothetical protein
MYMFKNFVSLLSGHASYLLHGFKKNDSHSGGEKLISRIGENARLLQFILSHLVLGLKICFRMYVC